MRRNGGRVMEKKLQVFVSSTYIDLIKERQKAVEAILSAGHIPAGMELFSAGNDSQLEVIQQWIDESDVYMLILGARYGSIEPKSQKSYTHLEYEYALKKKKPIFTIVMSDSALDKKLQEKGKEILELDNPKEYKVFKEKVLKKICKFCDDEKDIHISVLSALQDIKKKNTLSGWVSGKEITQANEVITQNTMLIKENEKLKKENEKLKKQLERNTELINGYTIEEIITRLSSEKIVVKKEIAKSTQDLEFSVLKVFDIYQDKFAIGVSNQYGASEIESLLFFRIAPKLMMFGLVEKNKVAKVIWERITTTKEGFLFLSKYKDMTS